MIRYALPTHWIHYNASAILPDLVAAKSAVQALTSLPYQKSWVEALQQLQLKREVAGTSRIEGAEFTDRELEEAINPTATPEELRTRSQRQAHAAMSAYRWIQTVPTDRPITADLVLDVHRRMVTGCDDDHCPPGVLRGRDHNVTFGIPPHRGVEGGPPCEEAFAALMLSAQREFQGHDLLVQAIAIHYHLAAMHPFLDGNGRTARAMEALVLRRAGLTDRAFVAMSNYYYDEKPTYLSKLSEVRSGNHDLTPFLKFALRGVQIQCERLTAEIRKQMQRVLFRDTMYSLFNRLQSQRKRVIQVRQIEILKLLLDLEGMELIDLYEKTKPVYQSIQNGKKAFIRDIGQLADFQAVILADSGRISINLDWPQQIDEGEFLRRMKTMPKGKTFNFLS